MAEQRGIVVTGMGAVSSVGSGCDALWDAVASGRSGIRPIERFSTEGYSTCYGATVPGRDREQHFDPITGAEDLCVELAVTAAREALQQAGLSGVPGRRIGLVLGTCQGDADSRPHPLTAAAAETLGITGPCITASTVCSSSINAIGIARHLLRRGAADFVIAGGADVLTPLIFAGFHALKVLSPEPCAPFSTPTGTSMGEGAGFVVLELAGAARARGAEPIATISGYGLSGDAFHETSPDPKGLGLARAIGWAIADSGLEPADIGYINTHGTGTAANDQAEWQAIRRVFGARAGEVPFSATKSIIGHGLGAAGALEGIVTIQALRRGLVPQTLNHRGPRPHCPPDPVAGDRPRPHRYAHALCQGSGFGGANAVAVISAPDAGARPPGAARPGDLELIGLGAIGPFGLDLGGLRAAIASGRRMSGGVPDLALEDLIPHADPRGLDPTTCLVAAVAARALADAGVAVHGDLRDRAGIVLGSDRVSPTSVAALDRSVEERGMMHLSTNAFARIILNAPAGICSKLLSLRGPNLALSTGPGSGLAAVIVAAELLAELAEVEMLLACGVDERAADGGDDATEGAGGVLIARSERPRDPARRRVRLAGWALGGVGDLEGTVARALDMAGLERDDCGAVFCPDDLVPVLGRGASSLSALACATAALAVRGGESETALVTTTGVQSVSGALILTAKGEADES